VKAGILFALAAYACWGFLPLYLRLLQHVSAIEIVAHRIIWSVLLLIIALIATKRLRLLVQGLRAAPLRVYTLAAVLIALNWGAYVWGVNNGRIVEVSLGYFVLPLVSVLLGRLFLGERLAALQVGGVMVAAVGVGYFCYLSGGFPWVGLVVALSFSFYSLAKKYAPLPALEGLAVETGLLAVPALLTLAYLRSDATLTFPSGSVQINLLLAGTGMVTALPLLLFAAAAKRVTLASLGMLQYVSPTIQFFIGVFVFHEVITPHKLLAFIAVWTGLALFVTGLVNGTKMQNVRSRTSDAQA